jgi:type III secretion protein V
MNLAPANVLTSRGSRGLRGARNMAALLARHNDLALALLLVAIVALFVLPLPTPLMDLLIASNLAVSLVLLIVAMYVPTALSLSTFPSLLLFTTLFRLALNIASTKLILLHANAGHIIDTFGKLIVGNNVVVGGVVFLIIAIVQFIVIAKGSERVAEVAARFALDAMPGKQMSIDAEMRSGALSSAQAQQRRRALEQESQLNGAMDGAMKFVKGDAIAGIVIALVNILAGVAVGTLMHGMNLAQALQRYAILTVGDGMVSQIPSLLVSIAAGVVITRVSSADERGSQPLAAQILEQVSAHPRALLIAATALCAFLLVPGFPKWAFGIWVLLVAALGLATLMARRRGRRPSWISHHEAPASVDDSGADAVTYPVALRLAPALRQRIDTQAFDRAMVTARTRAELEIGPVYPQMQLGENSALAEHDYEVLVQDVKVAGGTLPPDAGGEDALVAAVDVEARRHAPQLIGLQEVQRLLHWMQVQAPDLAAEAARSVPSQRIAETLRRLLQEGVPVRNLRVIFESLLRWAPQEEDGTALAELVRVDLGPYITSRHVGADRKLNAVMFDSALLDRIVAAIERSPRGNLLLLANAVKQSMLDQLQPMLARSPAGTAVVVSTDVRRYVRMLIDPIAPRVPVLSFQELDEDVTLLPVGWVANPQDELTTT